MSGKLTQAQVLMAKHLRELCEVTDERWRPAIEIAFTRKFAVVVAPDHYDDAELPDLTLYACRDERGAGFSSNSSAS